MGFLVYDFWSLEVLSHHLIYCIVRCIQMMVDFLGYTPAFTNGWITKMMGLGKGGSGFKYGHPWEPTTFIFRCYIPYIGGCKPSFFMVSGSKGCLVLYLCGSFHGVALLPTWGDVVGDGLGFPRSTSWWCGQLVPSSYSNAIKLLLKTRVLLCLNQPISKKCWWIWIISPNRDEQNKYLKPPPRSSLTWQIWWYSK